MAKQIVLFLGFTLLLSSHSGVLSSQVPLINQQGKFGYGSSAEDYPIEYPYDYGSYFNAFDQGLVKQNGKWSLIDNNYKIIAGGWDSADVFRFESLEANQQTVYVMMDGKWKVFLPKSKYYSDEFDSICTDFRNVFTYTDQIQPLWCNGKIKLMNKKTSIVSPAYDGIYFDNSNTLDFEPDVNYFMKLDGKVVVTNANGIAKNTYDYMDTLQPIWNSCYAVKRNGEWNYMTYKGKLGLKKWIPDSNFFNTLDIGTAFIKQKGKRYSIDLYSWDVSEIHLYNDEGEIYDEIYNTLPIRDNPGSLALVKREKYGFVDKDLNIQIPFIYDDGYDFDSDLAFVKKDGFWGAISNGNQTIISFQYQDCKKYGSEYIVKKDGRYGLLNYSGNEMIGFDYEDMNFTGSNGIFAAYRSGKWGLISYNGKIILNFEFEDVKLLNADFSAVKTGGLWGIYDLKHGKMIMEPKYEGIAWTNGKIAIGVLQWDQYLVDVNSGNTLTSMGYFSIGSFVEGLAVVKRWDKATSDFLYGFIDENGVEVIPTIYTNADNFSNGKAVVKKGKKDLFIDNTGKEFSKEKKGK